MVSQTVNECNAGSFGFETSFSPVTTDAPCGNTISDERLPAAEAESGLRHWF